MMNDIFCFTLISCLISNGVSSKRNNDLDDLDHVRAPDGDMKTRILNLNNNKQYKQGWYLHFHSKFFKYLKIEYKCNLCLVY